MDDRLLAGRYRLLEPLGHGGMAQVHRGWDELLGRPVAVKTMELGGADPASAARFGREAVTTAWLSHPNIVTVFDTGTDESTAFIVMELLAGPSLEARLTQTGPLPVAEAIRVAMQVADALDAAHAAGVVHRDIKPHNICYCADGRVKVLDFGIAHLAGQTRLTRTAMVMGTADYLAPEQATGGPVGAHSDLYALGCVLFAMLTGAPPFAGGPRPRCAPGTCMPARPPWPACGRGVPPSSALWSASYSPRIPRHVPATRQPSATGSPRLPVPSAARIPRRPFGIRRQLLRYPRSGNGWPGPEA